MQGNIKRVVSDGKADAVFLGAGLILLLNMVSPAAAFPFQIGLLIWCICKCDVKYLPSMFVLMLNKHCFTFLPEVYYVKFRLAGFGFSVLTTYSMALFAFVIWAWIRRRFDQKAGTWIMLWLFCLFPACWIAFHARTKGVSFWQSPFSTFMMPALYFWGVLAGRTWEAGKQYLCKRLVLIYLLMGLGALTRTFYVFSFVDHVMPICLFVCFLHIRVEMVWRGLAALGALVGLANVTFGRYLGKLSVGDYADSTELGTTFTRVAVVALGILFAMTFGKMVKGRSIRSVPYFGLVFCLVIFCYAVGRARMATEADLSGQLRSWSERFEYKLIADRGVLWNESLEEVIKPPLVFKRMEDRVVDVLNVETGGIDVGMRCMAHNQVLQLLIDSGWWMGLYLVLFLWWTFTRAFYVASFRTNDVIDMVAWLAPYAAVFIAVGLTGQTVLDNYVCSNGMVTMAFPGLLHGAYLCATKRRFAR